MAGAVFGWAAVITLVLTGVSAVAGFSEMRDVVTARRRRVARARVLAAEVCAEKRDLRTFHKPHVEFAYCVADQDLLGDEVTFHQKAYPRADSRDRKVWEGVGRVEFAHPK